jgi:hypothetical protein
MLDKLKELRRGRLAPAKLLAAAPWPPSPGARRELLAALEAFMDALEAKLARLPALTAADLAAVAGQVEADHLDDLDSEDRELGHVLFEQVGRALGLPPGDTPLADLPPVPHRQGPTPGERAP